MRWKRIFALLFILLLLGAGGWFLAVRMERGDPVLTFEEEIAYIGKKTEWSFVVEDPESGLREVRVWVRQGPDVKTVLAEDFPSGGFASQTGVFRREVTVAFDPKALSLADGAATVIVAAQDNSLWGFKGNSSFREFSVTVDTISPRVDLLSMVHNVRKGGTGLVIFRLGEEPEEAGVQFEEMFFPAYSEGAGGQGAHLAFFAVPHDVSNNVRLSLVVKDRAGNETRRFFPSRILQKRFPRDTVGISDRFLARKVPEFQAVDPSLDSDLLQAFLTVNRDWRRRDHERLRELTRSGSPRRLWSGAFQQMKNTQNMSPYAVRRTYTYKGKTIDKQVHLGLDLASTSGASVTASNTGIVTMAGELGIYGQSVLLDHGQGLFSLYSHLSGIDVEEGASVRRGQRIGSSGQTGMAGGDHLHFSIIVSGEFVNPVEWFDSNWIADNIDNKLDLLSVQPIR